MSAYHERVIRSFLRPTEDPTSILYISILPEHERREIPKGLMPVQCDPFKLSGNLLMVVVKHYNHTMDVEEGGLFFFDLIHSDGTIKALDALPITNGGRPSFTLMYISHSPPRGKEENGLPERSSWCVTIKRNAQKFLFAVHGDLPNIKGFINEYRRLEGIASTQQLGNHMWIEAYFSDPSSRCLDLRLRNMPLYRRLSPAVAGSAGDDISDISIVCRDWIEHTSVQRASTGSFHRLKIRLGTFNVNGKVPSQDLSPWLRGSETRSQPKNGWISPLKLSPFEVSVDPLHQELGEKNVSNGTPAMQAFEDPDIFVLGFQELDLSAEALLYSTSTVKEEEWSTAIFAGLGEKGVLYEKLVSKQLVGMLLIIIVKKTLVSCFTDIRSCDAGTGLLGFMGNKGATAIRLEFSPKVTSDPQTIIYQPTILTFVNSHLAAADEMVGTRNDDYAYLSEQLEFPANTPNPTTYNIFESDVLFWIGDLNYRLDLPDQEIRTLLSSQGSGADNIAALLAFDQLKAVIWNHEAFVGFAEPPITHLPTYRLGLGATVVKDQLGYDLKRKPAWTDRVLYMTPPGIQATPVAYRNHPEITMSDHFPVSADFEVSWELLDQSQREKSVAKLHRELAGYEDSRSKPKIKVKPHAVELGSVKYKQPIEREVVLQNEGDTPCVFRFVASGTDPEPIPCSWLHVEPTAGVIRPKESVALRLTVYVDDESAATLNFESLQKMECILVLHTLLGKDDFLIVTGDYEYTCFGNSLKRLARLNGPIREFKSEEESLSLEEDLRLPEVFKRLTDWMMTNVSEEPFHELFDYPADESLCQVIRECLDTGNEFPTVESDEDRRSLATAFANTLLTFLDLLIEPVVPAYLHARCLEAKDHNSVVDEFPKESINVWISLMAFLHFLTQQSSSGQNGDANSANLDIAYKLATIFAPILLRDDLTGKVPRVSPIGKRDFILRSIINE